MQTVILFKEIFLYVDFLKFTFFKILFCFVVFFSSVKAEILSHRSPLLCSDSFPSQPSVECFSILGDPGAVSRAGRKGATKVFKHERTVPVLGNFRRVFSSGPTDCPWVWGWCFSKSRLHFAVSTWLTCQIYILGSCQKILQNIVTNFMGLSMSWGEKVPS